jgi:hypothetical protein
MFTPSGSAEVIDEARRCNNLFRLDTQLMAYHDAQLVEHDIGVDAGTIEPRQFGKDECMQLAHGIKFGGGVIRDFNAEQLFDRENQLDGIKTHNQFFPQSRLRTRPAHEATVYEPSRHPSTAWRPGTTGSYWAR